LSDYPAPPMPRHLGGRDAAAWFRPDDCLHELHSVPEPVRIAESDDGSM